MTHSTWSTWGSASARQRLARQHEARVVASAHPVAWRIARLARHVDPDVVRVPGLGYLVSGAELLRAIQLDGAHFVKNGPGSTGEIITQVMGPCALANMDGAGHAELRRWLQPLFAGGVAGGPADAAYDVATDLMLASFRDDGAADLAQVSRMAAAAAVSRLVDPTAGLLPHELLELHHLATRLANCLSVRVRRLTDDAVSVARSHRARMLETLFHEANPGGGDGTLIGWLMQKGLPADEAGGLCAMVMVAGMETTSAAVARLCALFSDVGAWPWLADNPEAVPAAVDEGLRYVAPLLGVTRLVAEDRSVRGWRFRRGSLVVGHIHAAVRDGRVITGGEDFDPTREIPTELRHLWFGAGAHFCVGMPIARAALVKIIGSVAESGGLEVLDRRPARRLLVPTYDRLMVRRPHAAGHRG